MTTENPNKLAPDAGPFGLPGRVVIAPADGAFYLESKPIMKKCIKCGELKSLSEYYAAKGNKDGINNSCKDCVKKNVASWRAERPDYMKAYMKKYTAENMERRLEYQKKWLAEHPGYREAYDKKRYAENSDQVKARSKRWISENREKANASHRRWRKRNPEIGTQYNKKWKAANPDKAKLISRRSYVKAYSQTATKISICIRAEIRYSLGGTSRVGKWQNVVGYTIEQLKNHLEKQFKTGMTWDNYGPYWQIDHKIPVKAFNFETTGDIDFKRCWALKNLQPLERIANIRKGAKVERPFQPSLSLSL